MSQSRGNFNTYKKILLKAGQIEAPQPITGQFFECKEASHPFEMNFQDGEWFQWNKGRAFRLPEQVTRWSFRCMPGAEDTLIEIYIGNVDILISRPFVTQEEGATIVLAADWSGYPAIAAGATVTLDGEPPLATLSRRRSLICNQQVSGNLFQIQDGNGGIIATLDELPYELHTSGPVKIKNTDSGPHNIYVAENWYQIPM